MDYTLNFQNNELINSIMTPNRLYHHLIEVVKKKTLFYEVYIEVDNINWLSRNPRNLSK